MRFNLPFKYRKAIKKYLPGTLFGRFLMIIVTPVLLLQMITTIIFFDRHWRSMSNRLAQSTADEISMVIRQIETAESKMEVDRVINLSANTTGLLVSFDGERKFDNVAKKWWIPNIEQFLTEKLTEKIDNKIIIEELEKDKWFQVFVETELGVVKIIFYAKKLYTPTSYIFILWLFGSSFVLFAIAILFMRNQIKPIYNLARAAELFGKGIDCPEFKPSGAKEIRLASKSFINMQNRIKRQIEQRTEMLAGVSHDLRTPLTRMKLQLAILGDSPDIEDLKSDVNDMQVMIDAYLSFTRGDGDEIPKLVNMSDLLNKIVQDAKRNDYQIIADINADIELIIKKNALERAIVNLVSNAAKYADNIWLHTNISEENLEIYIEDDGKGIPEDKIEDVFKPFFRLEGSRNSKTGGVGLGLSISRDIIHIHGGDIKLSRSERSGLKVLVEIPA